MSETPTTWWKEEALRNLSEVVSLINESRLEPDSVRGFQILAEAANRLWTQLYRYQERNSQLSEKHKNEGRGDTNSFEQLLVVSLSIDAKLRLLEAYEFSRFVGLHPTIMSHDILRRENYDPDNITESLREKSSGKHLELAAEFKKYAVEQTAKRIEKLVKALADLLFVIRSNIAHGEKTPRGPDLNKTERDQQVCKCARPVLNQILAEIFEQPDNRLAIYGTLAPGGANHSKLSGFHGKWIDAQVSGRLHEEVGLSYFAWDLRAPKIGVKVFESENLRQNWESLDRFEGLKYQRIWVVTSIAGCGSSVVNIYEKKAK